MYYIDEQLRQALLNYLSQRPWHEVNDGIQALLTLKPAVVEQKDE